MSHFTVLVIGENPERQLEPFDENINVPEYINGEVSQKEKDQMIEYYVRAEKFVYLNNFDELYNKYGSQWNSNAWRKHSDGTWYEYSTYNPNSKWDWYVLGGRWSGKILKLKPGTTGIVGESGSFNNETGVDQALSQDIENLQEIRTFAYLKDGVWHQQASMGWWGMTGPKLMTDEEWGTKIKEEILKDIPDDTLISVYDCHI